MKKSKLFFLIPYILWLGLFVIAPIILITINAFKGDDGFTLKNFQQFLSMVLFKNDSKFILVCILNYLNYAANFLSNCLYFKPNEKPTILAVIDYFAYLD